MLFCIFSPNIFRSIQIQPSISIYNFINTISLYIYSSWKIWIQQQSTSQNRSWRITSFPLQTPPFPVREREWWKTMAMQAQTTMADLASLFSLFFLFPKKLEKKKRKYLSLCDLNLIFIFSLASDQTLTREGGRWNDHSPSFLFLSIYFLSPLICYFFFFRCYVHAWNPSELGSRRDRGLVM